MEKIMPLRDLSVWENREVFSLATLNPTPVSSLEPESLREFLSRHPQSRFPVVIDSECKGILDRAEAVYALDSNRPPNLLAPAWITPHETLSHARKKLLEAPANLLLVAESPHSPIMGLVTFHDFLRAETEALEGNPDKNFHD
jgi:CBS domain containing-hemolysin-like protein